MPRPSEGSAGQTLVSRPSGTDPKPGGTPKSERRETPAPGAASFEGTAGFAQRKGTRPAPRPSGEAVRAGTGPEPGVLGGRRRGAGRGARGSARTGKRTLATVPLTWARRIPRIETKTMRTHSQRTGNVQQRTQTQDFRKTRLEKEPNGTSVNGNGNWRIFFFKVKT